MFLPMALQATTPQDYHFQTKDNAKRLTVGNLGDGWIVDQGNFSVLNGVTCYTLEVWDESMRLPHWHPNASELGYVRKGIIEIILWRSPGETSVFTVGEGMCWFIPQGALHSLNNISEEKAELLVGFSSSTPQNVDLPVAFNGIPAPIRNAYTSPHADLKNWSGPISSPYFGDYTPNKSLKDMVTGSPYRFDFAQATPLFANAQMGSVIWGIKDNWNILEDISVLRAHLKPSVARDPIWYPDVNTLYVVSEGSGQFHIVLDGIQPQAIDVKPGDYFFVPVGTLHTFINTTNEDFEVIAFFTKANPLPEVSLSVSTAFFPNNVKSRALTGYAGVDKKGDPLQFLKYTTVSPYLLPLETTQSTK